MVVIWRESDLQDLLSVKLQPLENRIISNRKYQDRDLLCASLRSDRGVFTSLIRQNLILISPYIMPEDVLTPSSCLSSTFPPFSGHATLLLRHGSLTGQPWLVLQRKNGTGYRSARISRP